MEVMQDTLAQSANCVSHLGDAPTEQQLWELLKRF